ncbi:MAG TPA: cobalamin-dependent protein [Anaerolineae bacterium]|nr:cobalamin-dependent protein [Anaerolineae bacterium]
MSDSRMNNLVEAILEGDCAESVSQVEHLYQSGVSSEHIVIRGIETAMTALDAKCTLEQFNLLEIMLAGRAVTEVMKVLYPAGTAPMSTKGTVVIATLEGDVHDLGKNILKMVLIGKGYHVVDCGKDCSLQKLMDVTEKERPLAIGVSGLITPIIPLVRQVKEQLLLRKLDSIKVVAGGAALKQSSSDHLNVDFVAESAFDILHYLDGRTGEK